MPHVAERLALIAGGLTFCWQMVLNPLHLGAGKASAHSATFLTMDTVWPCVIPPLLALVVNPSQATKPKPLVLFCLSLALSMLSTLVPSYPVQIVTGVLLPVILNACLARSGGATLSGAAGKKDGPLNEARATRRSFLFGGASSSCGSVSSGSGTSSPVAGSPARRYGASYGPGDMCGAHCKIKGLDPDDMSREDIELVERALAKKLEMSGMGAVQVAVKLRRGCVLLSGTAWAFDELGFASAVPLDVTAEEFVSFLPEHLRDKISGANAAAAAGPQVDACRATADAAQGKFTVVLRIAVPGAQGQQSSAAAAAALDHGAVSAHAGRRSFVEGSAESGAADSSSLSAHAPAASSASDWLPVVWLGDAVDRAAAESSTWDPITGECTLVFPLGSTPMPCLVSAGLEEPQGTRLSLLRTTALIPREVSEELGEDEPDFVSDLAALLELLPQGGGPLPKSVLPSYGRMCQFAASEGLRESLKLLEAIRHRARASARSQAQARYAASGAGAAAQAAAAGDAMSDAPWSLISKLGAPLGLAFADHRLESEYLRYFLGRGHLRLLYLSMFFTAVVLAPVGGILGCPLDEYLTWDNVAVHVAVLAASLAGIHRRAPRAFLTMVALYCTYLDQALCMTLTHYYCARFASMGRLTTLFHGSVVQGFMLFQVVTTNRMPLLWTACTTLSIVVKGYRYPRVAACRPGLFPSPYFEILTVLLAMPSVIRAERSERASFLKTVYGKGAAESDPAEPSASDKAKHE